MSTTKNKIQNLKNLSGTHSPSIATILREIPEIKIKIDACFLSNPYATDLFLNHFNTDLIINGNLRSVLEYYPPQNREISKGLSKILNINSSKLFIGNGAIEIIQAVIHSFSKKKICVIIPTFSSYYEFVNNDTEVIYYHLNKEDNYNLNIDDYINFIKIHKPDTIVIINPNNPTGTYIKKNEIIYILQNLTFIDNIIIDESFIHFAYENNNYDLINYYDLVNKYPNLVLIKSMSKDFGIAGIRAGYGVMNDLKVNKLLSNGYLWNSSGLSDYFFKLYSNPQFFKDYNYLRIKYINDIINFGKNLNLIKNLNTINTMANFYLLELNPKLSSFDFTIDCLIDHNIYLRDCSDKIGLDGNFIRVAARTNEENLEIFDSFKKILN